MAVIADAALLGALPGLGRSSPDDDTPDGGTDLVRPRIPGTQLLGSLGPGGGPDGSTKIRWGFAAGPALDLWKGWGVHVIDGVKDCDLFSNLDSDRLERLSVLGRGAHHRKGTLIFIEEDEATDLYILRSGMVVLEMGLRPSPERPVMPTPLESITPGECFGWSAIVEPHSYTLTSRCLEDCSTLAISGRKLREAMAADPGLGYEVMSAMSRVIAHRLAETRFRLTSGIGLILQQHEIGAAG